MQNALDIRFWAPQKVWQALRSGALLVDVREAEELQECAYDWPDVLHFPYSDLKSRFHELPVQRQLVLACLSGRRSLRAAAYLSFKGHASVAHLDGGLRAWQKEGLPVVGEGCAETEI